MMQCGEPLTFHRLGQNHQSPCGEIISVCRYQVFLIRDNLKLRISTLILYLALLSQMVRE